MLEQGYTSLLTDKYQLTDPESIQTVDFENDNEGATEQINQWIYRNTNGMIDPMYEEPLDPDMAILLSSSLYFKGTFSWLCAPASISVSTKFCESVSTKNKTHVFRILGISIQQ